MNYIRQEEIRRLVEKQGLVLINELQKLYPEVSLMTIHRDLDKLQDAGYLTKIRGGARSVSQKTEVIFEGRSSENIAAKQIIAKKALMLIQANTCIFLDSGTTIREIARMMSDINVTVFTTGPHIAMELRQLSQPTINICGGSLNRQTLSLSGQNTLKMLDDVNIDLAIIGVSGFSLDVGFSCGQEAEMLVKQKVIKKARKVVAVFDNSKLEKIMPYTFATLSDFDYLIVDQKLPKEYNQAIKSLNIQLL